MYKIGFLGSDNSHVEKFCEILNLNNHEKFWAESGVKVTGIWGEDNELTKKMASYGKIKNIASKLSLLNFKLNLLVRRECSIMPWNY